MKIILNNLRNIFLLFLILNIFLLLRLGAITEKEMESKSEYELYNIASEYFQKKNDQEAFKVVKYLLENKNPRNKQALYILIEILIRNIDNFSQDKKKRYILSNN